jgi:hypothetical protein
MTTLLQVQPLLDTWQPAGWKEFVALADDSQSNRFKSSQIINGLE